MVQQSPPRWRAEEGSKEGPESSRAAAAPQVVGKVAWQGGKRYLRPSGRTPQAEWPSSSREKRSLSTSQAPVERDAAGPSWEPCPCPREAFPRAPPPPRVCQGPLWTSVPSHLPLPKALLPICHRGTGVMAWEGASGSGLAYLPLPWSRVSFFPLLYIGVGEGRPRRW